MTTDGGFAIELLEARWLTDPERDLCAHGTVRVRVGAAEVTVDDLNVAFGVLGALRTLEADRSVDADHPLFPHACNLFLGCPVVAIDWSVRHAGAVVHVGDLLARPGGGVAAPAREASIDVSRGAYRDAVVGLARAVRRFYGPPDRKIIAEEWERPLFEEFWAEVHTRFARHDRRPHL